MERAGGADVSATSILAAHDGSSTAIILASSEHGMPPSPLLVSRWSCHLLIVVP